METRGRIILISLFILTIFFTGCKKDDFFGSKNDSKNKSYYDDFNKSKKEKEKEKEKEKKNSDGGCQANDNEQYQGHGRKITICHNGHMITISVNAVLKHFNNHSTDRLFACDGDKSVAYSDIDCTLKYIMAQNNLNPNSKYSLQRAFNIWIDQYFLAGRWPSAKVNCDGTTGTGTTTGGGTTNGGGTTTTTDPGTTTGGGTTTTTDPGTTTGGGTTTTPVDTTTATTVGGTTTTTDPGTTTTTPPTPTIPVCHNGAILDQEYLVAYVNSQNGDLLIACEFAAGGVSFYDVEPFLFTIIADYGIDATAPDAEFQAFVIWYQDYYLKGNWPPVDATGGAGGAPADGGSGTGSTGTVIITN